MPVDPRVSALCAEFDIEIIHERRYPNPGQTRAVVTIRRIIDRQGEAHARLVLCTLAETKGSQGIIDEVSLWAVSDLVRACPEWVEDRASDWLAAWDRLPMGQYMATLLALRGLVPQRPALVGLCFMWLQKELAEPEPDDRKYSRLSDEDKIAVGRELIRVKGGMQRGHFGTWLRERSGINKFMAQRCMKLARRAIEAETGRPPLGQHRRTPEEQIETGRLLIAKKAELPRRTFGKWLAKQNGISLKTAQKYMTMARKADAAA